MAWHKKLIEQGDGLLGRFDHYNATLKAERKQRQETRRNNVLVVDRTMALMLDFMVIILLFSSTLLDSGSNNMIIAGIMAKLMQDPDFQSVQAMRALHETGALRIMVASSLSQLIALMLIVLPSLYFLQATPGMYVLGIRMRRTDRVTKPGFWRCVGFFFSGILFLTPFMLSYLWTVLRRDRRALHDVASGVVLLRRRVIEQEKQQRILREAKEAEAASAGMAAE